MSNRFKKNTPINTLSEQDNKFINDAEDITVETKNKNIKYSKKEFTFPLSAKHAGLLEKIYNYYDQDISRRKLGAKALSKGIEAEADKLGITISDNELE
jgi:hypothetical protein